MRVTLSGKELDGIVLDEPAPEKVAQLVEEAKIEEISSASNDVSGASEEELRLWEFISDYYLCSLCEVYRAARPALYAESERKEASARQRAVVRLKREKSTLAARTARLQEQLENVGISLKSARSGTKKEAQLHERRGKLQVELSRAQEALNILNGKEEQADTCGGGCTRKAEKPIPGKPVLISGNKRTSIYMDAIAKCLSENCQALVLTPDTAFCKRIETVLKRRFGNKLHTVSTDTPSASRGRTAMALRRGESLCIVGTKASIFLPFSRLGLVIIDEEQESLYRQSDNAPRYNVRDTALMLAKIHGAQAMLGSAFPSLESLNNCCKGKYQLSELGDSSGALGVVDIGAEKRKSGMNGYFSRKLLTAIRNCSGSVTLIRGWEKRERLDEEIAHLLPGIRLNVMSLQEFKRDAEAGMELIAVLQADAFVGREDFRSDEKALQLVAMLRGFARKVMVQTEVPSRFDGSRSAEDLLQERRRFGYPPFTRLVEIRSRRDDSPTDRKFLTPGPGLSDEKRRILESLDKGQYAVVDP